MRAIVLPTVANPAAFAYWVANIDASDIGVDLVSVCVSCLEANRTDESWSDIYIEIAKESKTDFLFDFNDEKVIHGPAISRCLDLVGDECTVAIMDDDCFICRDYEFASRFQYIEDGCHDLAGQQISNYLYPQFMFTRSGLLKGFDGWGKCERGSSEFKHFADYVYSKDFKLAPHPSQFYLKSNTEESTGPFADAFGIHVKAVSRDSGLHVLRDPETGCMLTGIQSPGDKESLLKQRYWSDDSYSWIRDKSIAMMRATSEVCENYNFPLFKSYNRALHHYEKNVKFDPEMTDRLYRFIKRNVLL